MGGRLADRTKCGRMINHGAHRQIDVRTSAYLHGIGESAT